MHDINKPIFFRYDEDDLEVPVLHRATQVEFETDEASA